MNHLSSSDNNDNHRLHRMPTDDDNQPATRKQKIEEIGAQIKQKSRLFSLITRGGVGWLAG